MDHGWLRRGRGGGRGHVAARLAVGLVLGGGALVAPLVAAAGPAGAASLPTPGTLDTAYGVSGIAPALPAVVGTLGPAELATVPPGSYTSGAEGDVLAVSQAAPGQAGSASTGNLDVTRLTPTGALDGSFGSSGVTGLFPSPVGVTATVTPAGLALAPPGSYPDGGAPGDAVVAAAYQPSSAGSGATDLAVTRLTPSGEEDPTFAGTLSSATGPQRSAFGVTETGVPPTSAGTATPGSVLLELACPGSPTSDVPPVLDLPATGGVALEEPGGPSSDGEPGDILLGGIATCGNTSYALVVRLTPAGALDTSFGTGGVASVALPTTLVLGSPEVAGVVLEPGGDVLVVGAGSSEGSSGDVPVLYEAGVSASNGSVDSSLGTGSGVALTPFPALSSISATAATAVPGLAGASGTAAPLAVVGTALPPSEGAVPAVLALNASGGAVAGYGSSGVELFSGLAAGATLRSVVALGGGAAAVAGVQSSGSGSSATASVAVAELTPGGALEPGFATGSTVRGVSLEPCAALDVASCGAAVVESGAGGLLASLASPLTGAAGSTGEGFGAVEALWGPIASAVPTTVRLSGSGGCLGVQVQISLTAPVYAPTDVTWVAARPPEAAAPTLGTAGGTCGASSATGAAAIGAGSTSTTATFLVANTSATPEGDIFAFGFALTAITLVGGGLPDAGLVPASDTTITIAAALPKVAGYDVLSANGGIHTFDAPWFGSLAGQLPRGMSAPAMAADPATGGYWVLTSNGGVHNFHTPWFGSLAGQLPKGVSAVSIAADPLTGGYWVLTSNGGVHTFGTPWFGSLTGQLPTGVSVTGIAADPHTGGYWVLTSNGGVHNFGAPWFGSLAGQLPTGMAATGIAPDPTTGGYWVLTSNGGVHNFGAPWFGSLAGKPLASPVRAVVAG